MIVNTALIWLYILLCLAGLALAILAIIPMTLDTYDFLVARHKRRKCK